MNETIFFVYEHRVNCRFHKWIAVHRHH